MTSRTLCAVAAASALTISRRRSAHPAVSPRPAFVIVSPPAPPLAHHTSALAPNFLLLHSNSVLVLYADLLIFEHGSIVFFYIYATIFFISNVLTLRLRQLGKEGSGSPHHRHWPRLYLAPSHQFRVAHVSTSFYVFSFGVVYCVFDLSFLSFPSPSIYITNLAPPTGDLKHALVQLMLSISYPLYGSFFLLFI